MSTQKHEIVKRIVVNDSHIHEEHEIIYDYPADGFVFDRCHQRFMPTILFYEKHPNEQGDWEDIRKITDPFGLSPQKEGKHE